MKGVDALDILPHPPKISEDDLARSRESGDYCPVLFEWYKYVGALCVFLAILRRESPGLRTIPREEYSTLIGLLNRCARLMLANVALSHEGRFGETTAILDRCIFETALKVIWLCESPVPDRFRRFIADGLKTELEFKSRIQTNIDERGGAPLPIEVRMLRSIDNYIADSGLSPSEVLETKKLPDLASIVDALGHDRTVYLAGQKIASHHVHGTWPSLKTHYLEERDGELRARDHDCATHVSQYVFIPRVVLNALSAFVTYVVEAKADVTAFHCVFDAAQDEIDSINKEVVGSNLFPTVV